MLAEESRDRQFQAFGSGLRHILDRRFRANPAYELIPHDRLAAPDRTLLQGLADDPDQYGVLRPRNGGSAKSVCKETALLFLTLGEAAKLPSYIVATHGADSNQAIAELVLDSVLEVEHSDGFVTGAEAHGVIYETLPGGQVDTRLSQLSVAALKYAQALEIADARRLSARMYFFNRHPLTARRTRLLGTEAAHRSHLSLREGDALHKSLERGWKRVSLPPPNDGWLMWRCSSDRAIEGWKSAFKLYISPSCEDMKDVFPAAVAAMSELGVQVFKVGSNLSGLLRPDKFVAYFDSKEALDEAALAVAQRISGCGAHGVPFTAEITPDGLLSWGMDPAAATPRLEWEESESWRLWLTNRLAVAILSAKREEDSAVEPWRFAVDRIRLEGVDPATWTPDPQTWAGRGRASA